MRIAPMGVAVDLRPFSFAEGGDGMANYPSTVFQVSVPLGENVDHKSYIPSLNAVTKILQKNSEALHKRFVLIFEARPTFR